MTDGLLKLFRGTVGRAYQYSSLHAGILLSPRRTLHGFEVAQLMGGREEPDLFAKVEEALNLVSEVAPRRLERLKKDIRRILLMHAGEAAGLYWHDLRACVLDMSYVREFPSHYIASTIVHEGTHARLRSAGVRYPATKRKRIEDLCIREEIRFARGISGADSLLEDAERRRALVAR
jgi:hypothetical protein